MLNPPHLKLPTFPNNLTLVPLTTRLLAKQNPSSNTNVPSTPRPISQRERSISAPNVNMIGQPDSGLIEV